MNNSSAVNASFTPILTPNRSGDVVLLSPSRSISETLTSLATLTGHQLDTVWNEVGYTPQERAAQLNQLIVQFKDLCQTKVAEEQGVAETFRQTIYEAKDEIHKLCTALQQQVPPSATSTTTELTLTDQLDVLETTLQDLRLQAAQARKDLQESLDFLLEAHEVLGKDMDPQWNDIDTNLTKERQVEFQNKRMELKAEVQSRSAAVVRLVRDCQQLMRELKIETESKTSSALDRQIAGSLVRSKDDSFIMASKQRTETCVGIGADAMEEMMKRLSELNAEKSRRKVVIQEMGHKISKLWEKLRISEEEQIAFTESVRGIGLDTIQKGEAELDRLESMKNEMIGQLVQEAREEIQELWDQIDADEAYRREFLAFYVDTEQAFDDDLLDTHEAYLGQLHERLEERKPLLRLIERREAIVKERMEYEELQKDPDRLKQRTAAVARQVMEEEKMARRIKRDLPKLTQIIEQKLHDWRERHGEDFVYHHGSYQQAMTQQERDWNLYKEQKKTTNSHSHHRHHATKSKATTHARTTHRRQPLGEAKLNL